MVNLLFKRFGNPASNLLFCATTTWWRLVTLRSFFRHAFGTFIGAVCHPRAITHGDGFSSQATHLHTELVHRVPLCTYGKINLGKTLAFLNLNSHK